MIFGIDIILSKILENVNDNFQVLGKGPTKYIND